jgi:hypothetical protein
MKPTRAEVQNVLTRENYKPSQSYIDVGRVANALIAAGLVEEDRQYGYYWTKWCADCAWEVSLWRGDAWLVWGNRVVSGAPLSVGARIEPPEGGRCRT